MKHLGDITLIKGNEAPTVDCIIGGSPCQDLSLAGKRAGLAGARSGLYMEQIRIIKEMRENDRVCGRSGVYIRPRYMVWENVPGAFSTNKGQDFAAVLEEAIRVAEPEAPSVSVPEKGWPTAGCIMGECWSIAWRVLDAQFWGTSDKPLPQRRRRIALVADFGGLSAPEILFVRKSVSGNIEPGKPKGKEASGDVGAGSDGAGKAVGFPLGFRPENVRCYDETATTLCNGTRPGFTTGVIQPIAFQGWAGSAASLCIGEDVCSSLVAKKECMIAHPVIAVDQGGGKSGANSYEDISPTLTCTHDGAPAVAYTYDARGNGDGQKCATLTGDHQNRVTDYTSVVLEPILLESNQNHATVQTNGISTTLTASMGMGGGYVPMVTHNAGYEMQAFARVKHIVRRLTPLECERLQGFPDGWTDIGEWVDSKGKKHKDADSPRYKALGNSIALPPWKWVLKRLCACYERDATMASLFDGIGGFPLIWEQINGKGSCLWASEIEEFPIAVTKLRFGG